MENDKSTLYLILALFAGALVYAFFKLGKNKGDGGDGDASDISCESGNSDEECEEIAKTLKDIFSEWYVSTTDESTVIITCQRINDECGAKKVYKAFGSLRTTMYGSGGLDVFLRGRLTESCRDDIRPYFHGVGNF